MLQRKTPLRRRGIHRSRYARRERDTEFMLDVKRLACCVRAHPPDPLRGATPCYGHVEADHAGSRGLGQKADDRTCIALCARHHNERTDHTGSFKHLTRDQVREWKLDRIAETQAEVAALREALS